MAADRILVFAKRPTAGRVKTRLVPPLSAAEAAVVYEACLRDVIALAARERARVELWYDDEPGASAWFAAELPHLPAVAQAAGDLGERMRDAFARSFASAAERVVVIGSDAPTLPDSVMNAAFDDLREADGVIGPSLDGGYYLIGVRVAAWPAARGLFDDIAWSSSAVFRQTLERAKSLALALRILPGWYDVDTFDDLRRVVLDATPDSNLGRWAQTADAQAVLRVEA